MAIHRTATVAFSIEGAWLTTLCRELVIEGNWRKGWKVLGDLHGITDDQRRAILSGDAHLEGVNDLALIQEPDPAYKARLTETFIGCYRNASGITFRPWARVTCFGFDDAAWAAKRVTHVREGKRASLEFTLARTLYYGREGDEAHLVRHAGESHAILCQRTPEPPYWVDVDEDPKHAIAAYLEAGHYLTTTGDTEALGDIHYEQARYQADVLPEDQKQAVLEAWEVDRDEAEAKRIEAIRAAVRKQADEGAGWLELNEAGHEPIQVPKAPFMLWALSRAGGEHLCPPWSRVAPMGMKMYMDNPMHTDWWIGAGLELKDAYSEAFTNLGYPTMYRLQKTMLNFECAVLTGSGRVTGTVVHPEPGQDVTPESIVVIPNAGPEYTVPALRAAAVITETGGKLTHLVTIGREAGARIVRVAKARDLYPGGKKVTIDLDSGIVHIDPRS